MPDRYSADEARRIFARAAERQHAVADRGEGLTTGELQAIGREVGLDPEHVAAAIAELGVEAPPEPVRLRGIDLTPRRARLLPGTLTDEVWEAMVVRLRRTYGTKGIASTVGRTREWMSGPESRLHVIARPVEGGTHVTLELSKAEEATGVNGPLAGVVTAAGLAAILSVLFAIGDFDASVWILPAIFLATGAAFYGGFLVHYRRWSQTRQRQFETLLDQFELDARSATPIAEKERIDPTLLDAEPAGSDAVRRVGGRARE